MAICKNCGEEFDKTSNNKKYCSSFCKKTAFIKVCPVCGMEFSTDREETQFCSKTCTNKHIQDLYVPRGSHGNGFSGGNTHAQQMYAKLFASGLSVAEIARKLGVSWQSVNYMWKKLSL